MFPLVALGAVLLTASPCETFGPEGRAGGRSGDTEDLSADWRERLSFAPPDEDATRLDATLVEERRQAYCRLEQRALEGERRAGPDRVVSPDRALLARFVEDDGKTWTTLTRKLVEWWESLTAGLITPTGKARVDALFGWVLLTVTLTTLALLVGLAVRRWKRRRGAGRHQGGPLLQQPERGDTLEPATVHLARASAHLADQPRESIREAWLAVLSTLEAHRLASPRRVHTNRELAEQLPQRGAPAELSRRFSALAQLYDATFYSLASITSERAGHFLNEVSRFQLALQEPQP